MIEHELLVGYAMDALDAAERETVRTRLMDDTAAQISLERIRKVLAPLEADRDVIVPPNLAANTLARLDSQLAVPRARGGSLRRIVELAVAASIATVGFGLAVTGVMKFNHENSKIACQNNLREMGVALSTYAADHKGQYPQVSKAGDFTAAIGPGKWQQSCNANAPVGYAYNLGHRDANGVHHPASMQSNMPVLADFPMSSTHMSGPLSPHGRGGNVLFGDGHARYTTSPKVGINSDDIYLNDRGEVKAGTHPLDAVLGRPDDIP